MYTHISLVVLFNIINIWDMSWSISAQTRVLLYAGPAEFLRSHISTIVTLPSPIVTWVSDHSKWWEFVFCCWEFWNFWFDLDGILTKYKSANTFHRMRLMMPNNSIPATAATMMIQRGTSYGVSSPSTGSMFTENYRQFNELSAMPLAVTLRIFKRTCLSKL